MVDRSVMRGCIRARYTWLSTSLATSSSNFSRRLALIATFLSKSWASASPSAAEAADGKSSTAAIADESQGFFGFCYTILRCKRPEEHHRLPETVSGGGASESENASQHH